MSENSLRNCPLCNHRPRGVTFPYATRFNSVQFNYLKCVECASVFVDPVPDSQTFVKMYAKADYHDLYYEGIEVEAYSESANLLKEFLPAGATVLDYGCGVGAFLKALTQKGFLPLGVEFDEQAALFAGKNANCETFSIDQFMVLAEKPKFDAVHLGDVLEHLPDPANTCKELLGYLKPGGVLFVEGPLETNPSLVYWVAKTFGRVKKIVNPDFVANHIPAHLFLTDAKQQLVFFRFIEPRLDLLSWVVYETGWPYSSGGVVKQVIAGAARLMSGKRLFGVTIGNRFRGVFRVNP
jgi:2-polyprenyl-3-methyl-5-hydroxy-6-metoxy-1,4-benzoquinol methylase